MRQLVYFIVAATIVAWAAPSPVLANDWDIEPTPRFPTSLSLNLADPPVEGDAADGGAAPGPADEVPLSDDRAMGYKGARGLITQQGMTGMFLNPTSGTLNQWELTVQYAGWFYNNDGPNNQAHSLMAALGVTDFLEIGFLFTEWTFNSRGQDVETFGPFFRFRLWREEDWKPEVSFMGMWIHGAGFAKILAKVELDLVASKRFVIDEDGFAKAVRINTGFRQIFRYRIPDAAPSGELPGYDPDDTASLVFLGGELELPYSLKLVAEVMSKDGYSEELPWALGVQWHPTNVLGFSAAISQGQGEDRISVYIGVSAVIKF